MWGAVAEKVKVPGLYEDMRDFGNNKTGIPGIAVRDFKNNFREVTISSS